MLRRSFVALGSAGMAMAGSKKRPLSKWMRAGALSSRRQLYKTGPVGLQAFANVQSGFKITGMKVFGVSLIPNSDRPYVFVKLKRTRD